MKKAANGGYLIILHINDRRLIDFLLAKQEKGIIVEHYLIALLWSKLRYGGRMQKEKLKPNSRRDCK